MLQFWPKRGKLSSARLFARMPKEPGTIPRFGDWVAQNQEDARVREEEKERNELMESFENGEYEEAAKFAARTPSLQTLHTMERFVVSGNGTIYISELKKQKCL